MYDKIVEITQRLDRTAQPLVIGGVRILVALMWLANLHWKVPPQFGEDTGGGLYKYSASVLRNSPFAPFTWVTEEIILPNFTFFGWFTLVAETALALLLLVGYKTKIVSLVGVTFAVPILLSVIYYDRADEWSWAYFLMIGIHLLLYAADAGKCAGLDGVLAGDGARVRRSLIGTGAVGAVVGLLGLFVARGVSFAGDEVALLGSDAGFVDGDGLVRRWELKLLFFNPLWAILTVVFAALLIVGARQAYAAYVGAAGFAVIAVAVFFMQTFDYARDQGDGVQVISTATNVAFWGGLALAGMLLARRVASTDVGVDQPAD